MKTGIIFDAIYGFLMFLMLLIQILSLLANGDDPAMWIGYNKMDSFLKELIK